MPEERSRSGYIPDPCADDCEMLKAKDEKIAELKAQLQAATSGAGVYHHDVWCNSDRRKPMGPGHSCSCDAWKRIKKAEADSDGLRGQVAAMRGQIDHLHHIWPHRCEAFGFLRTMRNADAGAPEAAVIKRAVVLRDAWRGVGILDSVWGEFCEAVRDMHNP